MKCGYLTRRITMAVLAVCLCAAAAVGVSLAYYTDTSNATGSVPFSVSPGTEITETFDGMNKDITIKNEATTPVVVRFKAVYPSADFATVTVESSSANWVVLNEDDGWIYYAQPLMGGAETDQLDVKVDPRDDAPSSFDITVIQQSAYAVYDAAGNLTATFGNEPTVTLSEGSYTSLKDAAGIGNASEL